MTSMRRRYVASTSFRRHMPAGTLPPPLPLAPQYYKPWPPNILNLAPPPNILNLPTPMPMLFVALIDETPACIPITDLYFWDSYLKSNVQQEIFYLKMLMLEAKQSGSLKYIRIFLICPAAAWRWGNVASTSVRRLGVALTLVRCCITVMCCAVISCHVWLNKSCFFIFYYVFVRTACTRSMERSLWLHL